MLIERHKSGVEVIVFSSNVKQDSYYAQAIHELKLGGIKHQTFSGRHDKLAIIDTEIVYIGSLNLLSHFGTIEYMLRIKSPRFVESLCKFIDLETMEAAPTKWGNDIKISICKTSNHTMYEVQQATKTNTRKKIRSILWSRG